jgi:hypothetical protein
MSLLRLLAAGKSLVGLEGSQSRYQVTRQRLPRFASKKNPFRATSRPEAPFSANGRPSLKAGNNMSGAEGLCAVKMEAARTVSEPEPGATRSREPAEKDRQQRENAKPPLPLRRETLTRPSDDEKFVSRLAALFPWRRVETGKPVIRELPKPLVQAELSLASVKVVRNDLSDSDLEVVRPQPPPPSNGAAPVVPKLPSHLASSSAWSRVTGRLFGLGRL